MPAWLLLSRGDSCIRDLEMKSRTRRVLATERRLRNKLRTRGGGKTPSCLICGPSKTKVQPNELEMVLFTGEHRQTQWSMGSHYMEITFITSGKTHQRSSVNEISDVSRFKYDEMGRAFINK